MFWNRKKKHEIIVIPETISIGDVFIDKIWKDTKIVIVGISKEYQKVRYKFIEIKGDKIPNSGIHDTSIQWLLDNNIKIL